MLKVNPFRTNNCILFLFCILFFFVLEEMDLQNNYSIQLYNKYVYIAN